MSESFETTGAGSFTRKEESKSIKMHDRLGKEIKISPKSHVDVCEPGRSIKYYVPTAEVLIGIGNDHTASLIMSEEALIALNNGAPISILTTEEYRKRYIRPVRTK